MLKVPTWAVVTAAGMILVWGLECRGRQQEKERAWQQRADSSLGAAKRAYQDTVNRVNRQLLEQYAARRDAEARTADAEARARRARARVDTVRLAFRTDSTVRDSLDTALGVIEAQDTALARQQAVLVGLTDMVRADSGVRRLFELRVAADSQRIASLEGVLRARPRGPRFLGVALPQVRCGMGLGVGLSLAGKPTGGPIAGCLLTLR